MKSRDPNISYHFFVEVRTKVVLVALLILIGAGLAVWLWSQRLSPEESRAVESATAKLRRLDLWRSGLSMEPEKTPTGWKVEASRSGEFYLIVLDRDCKVVDVVGDS